MLVCSPPLNLNETLREALGILGWYSGLAVAYEPKISAAGKFDLYMKSFMYFRDVGHQKKKKKKKHE